MELDFINKLFDLKFVFGLLMLVIWVGYVIFAMAIVGRSRVLARTLQTSLSAVNMFVSWIHLVLVVVVGVVALLLILI